ncbi:uncharacterized protein LOC118733633 [Rhagoletis pomonella]|uniref:uncharacterized protein LOC118733633 n=1 Tax=Rhagoletis pomonella TaxID=28610 RepID=UPI0017840C4F|nr:uncharacterized protein LOC118733633 [Rhagoletis pomonella]
MPPRRKYIFNADLQNQYSFITKTNNTSEVKCLKCQAIFSIANGGKLDIQQHLATNKHKKANIALSSSKTISNFFHKEVIDSNEKKVCINEGTWAFHTVKHNHSFRSNDCTSKLIKHCFDDKYSCARTKCESIICNVLAPNSIQQTKPDLCVTDFVTVYVDCSNHGSIKLCPILVRYFAPHKGIQVKILEVSGLPGESSDILTKYMYGLLKKFYINEKLLAICADNTNCNFGGARRLGKNNLYCKLQASIGKPLLE